MVSATACEPLRQVPRQGAFAHPYRRVYVVLLPVTVAVLLIWCAAWADARLAAQRTDDGSGTDLIYVPPTRVLRAVSLGYEHALADFLWFRTMSYFGRHYRSDRAYPWLAYMCNVVTDLDPRAEHVYRFGGVLLPWEANRVDDGIALLEKGVANVPDSWRMQYMLGFSHYFFHDDLAAASQALRAATLQPGAPEFVARLAVIVDAAERGPDKAIEFLRELERNASEEVRDAVHLRIASLVLARDIDALEAAVRIFHSRFGQLPDSLDELISAGIVSRLPQEPFGAEYLLDQHTGHVRSSSGHEPWRLGSSAARQAFLKGRTRD